MINRIKKTISTFNRININKAAVRLYAGAASRIVLLSAGLILTEYFYNLGSGYRTAAVSCLIFFAGILLFYTTLKFYRQTAAYRKGLRKSAANIESFMEGSSGILQLLDLLTIKEQSGADQDSSIVDAAIGEYEERFKKEILPSIFPPLQWFGYTKVLLPLLAIIVALLSYSGTRAAAGRLSCFRTEFYPPLSHTLALIENPSSVLEGDSLLLSCGITGQIPPRIELLKRQPGSKKWSSVTLAPRDSIASFLKYPVSDDFYYFFKTAETSSDTVRINVIKYPRVSKLLTEITPPSYSDLPSEKLDEIAGDLTVLKGSRVKFRLSADSPCDSVKIYFSKGERTTVNKLKRQGEGSFVFSGKLNYGADFYFVIHATRAGKKIESRDPLRYRVEILEDEYPVVKLISPRSGYQLGDEQTIPLVAAATDDYGVRSFFLYKKKIQDKEFLKSIGGKAEDFKRATLSFEKLRDGTYAVSAYLSLADLWLLPEDRVELFIRVYDNDNISGPKYSDSEHITVSLPSMAQMFAEAETKYEKQTDDISKNLTKSKNLKKMIKELSQELKAGKDLNWENRKKIEKAINGQKKMLKSVEEIEKSIKENIEKLDKNSMLSKETMSKYMKLQKMVDELFNEDLKQRLEKLSGGGENKEAGKKELDKMLSDFDAQQKTFQEGLEKTMKILKQIQQEYKLDKLLKKFNDLIEKQEKINLQVKDDKAPVANTVSQEKKLQKSYEAALQDVAKMEKSLGEEGGKTVGKLAAVSLKAASNGIAADFNRFSEKMESGKRGQATASGESIKEKLEDLAADLATAKDTFLNEQKEELDREIKREIENLLKLSFLTEELKNGSRTLAKKSPRGKSVIIRNTRIEKGFSVTSEKIFEISRKTFFIDKQIGARIGQINKNFETIRKHLGQRSFYLSAKEQFQVMGNINRLIMLLEKARSDIEKSKSPSGLQEMIEKMEEMAKKQADVNSQSQGMMKMPGMQGGQGQGGQQPQQDPMSQLAQQQAGLYQALQEMMEQMGIEGQQGKPGKDGKPGSDGQPGGEGGDGKQGQGASPGQNGPNGKNGQGQGQGKSGLGKKLSGMGEAMQDLLQEMQDKKMNESIRKRQDKLLKHMLETVKSMKKERLSDKRESKGTNLKALDPGEIDFSDPENSLREKLIRSLNDGYNRTYRKKIKEYFEKINE